MNELNRREFVAAAVVAAGACALCGGDELLAQSSASSAKITDIGTPADYASAGVSDKFLRSHRLLVVRVGKKLHAMSAVCTHKSCAVRYRENKIKCPCHGSAFSEQGVPTGGPARAALARYAIKLDDTGHIIVDRNKQIPEQKWEEPGSFIELE